jgi:radical SAM protein with 4Fe4S-binding SPASM domain
MTLIEYVKRKRLILTVSTNGLTLAEHGGPLADRGVDFLYVSIDGAGENHDRIRGLNGAFKKTVEGIRALQSYKKAHRRLKPYLLISAAVTKDNACNFNEIFEVAEEGGADGLVASYGWFQTEESCQQHEAIMREQLGVFPISHRGWLWSFGEIDVEGLVSAIKQIDARQWSFPFAFMPKLSYDEIPRYYREHSNTFGADQCKCPWAIVQVLPNGDVATCIDLPDYVAGNIREQSILEIWNNEKYRKFRSVLKQHGHLPACTRCSGLVGRGL